MLNNSTHRLSNSRATSNVPWRNAAIPGKNKNIIETQEHTINKNRKQIQMSEVFGNVFLD